ncbi:MAG: alpha/beta fold hydrolase [Myxococcota bacterium]
MQHRTLDASGLRMHVVEAGEGPLVLLCHGFPESWYSWRHQLRALADAGYRAVAPDMRGYGRSARPEPIEAYSQLQLVGDVVGLVSALGESRAVIVGHDWGAPVAWNAALLRPDVFRAVAALSVPFSAPPPMEPTRLLAQLAGDQFHYVLYFQEPGVAEAELEADPRHWLQGFFHVGSGDVDLASTRLAGLPKTARLSDGFVWPDRPPTWLRDEDLDFYAGEFERTGFRGGLHWYRNIDRSWRELRAFRTARHRVPALFIAGEKDGVVLANPAAVSDLPKLVPTLRDTLMIPGCGHWTQQERPEVVSQKLLEFLGGLED